MHLPEHSEVAPMDLPGRPTTLLVTASPATVTLAVPAALANVHHVHDKHGHRHKGGSQRGTTSKHCISCPSQEQLGEKSCADTVAPVSKRAKVDRKTKHIDKPETTAATGVPLEPR